MNTPSRLTPALLATPNAVDVLEARDRMGHVSGLVPRQLLMHPIWINPKTASCTSQLHRQWWDPVEMEDGSVVRWKRHTEISNPLGADTTSRTSPHGVLRFMDLDVVMALSHAWLTQGEHIEVSQADLLRWMGYDDLLIAPYDELHSSLQRLQATSIALWDGDERPKNTRVFRIVESAEFVTGPRNMKILEARLSPYWLDALRSGRWQEVDLDAYAHLTRNHRRFGLARVIYAYLTACRTTDGDFSVLKDAIVQRFAPRKPDGKSLRYADHANPKSALVRSMGILREAGVIVASDGLPTHLTGRFVSQGIPRLSDQFRQTRLCTSDIWGQGAAPTLLPSVNETESQPAPVPAAPAAAQPITDPVRLSIALLNRDVRCNKTVFQKAVAKGWSHEQLLHAIAEVFHGYRTGSVQRPGALLATFLRERFPAQYDRPPQAAWDWLRLERPDLPIWGNRATGTNTSRAPANGANGTIPLMPTPNGANGTIPGEPA
ncbi:MAG: hypothetical protein H0W72_01430 [Planctomycetes bacterium]|nr:hypothetical protein [Planctomycetota bacterium]